MDPLTIFALAIGGVSALGGIGANIYNAYQSSAVNEQQERLFHENQDWLSSMSELNYQRDLEKMRQEQRYNSPLEQVKRYQEAGINPAVAMSGQFGSASAGNVSAPSGSYQPGTPSIPLNHVPQLMSPDFTQVGKLYQAIAEGKKTDLETSQLQSLFDKTVRSFELDIESKELANFLVRTYGSALKDAEVREKIASATQALEAAYNYRESGKTQESVRAANQAQALMNEAAASLHGKQADLAQLNIDSYFTRLNSDLAEAKSRTASNYASASVAREQASQLRDLHSYIVNEKKWISRNAENLYKLDSAEVREKYATLDHYLSYINSHYEQLKEQDKLLVRELEEKVRHLEHTNDWRTYHEILEGLERTANAISGFIPLAPERSSSSSSQTIVSPNGKVTTIESENHSSRRRGR